MATPRPYHHGNLRAELLEAAERALEKGEEISLRELSRVLGVSHTSPRRHFTDKQALLDALAIVGFERFEASLARATKAPGHSFESRLMRVAHAYVNFALKHPALFALMSASKHRPDAPPEVLRASERAFGYGFSIFVEGQANKEVVKGEPGHLALVVFAALQGLIGISTKGKFKGKDISGWTTEIVERIIEGLRPRK